MTRSFTILLGAVAALALLAPACRKASDTAAAAPVELAVFPADSDFILSVSLDRLRQSPLWKGSGFEQRLADSDSIGVCGPDSIDKFRGITVGGELSLEGMVIVLDGLTREHASTCWAKTAEKRGAAFAMTDEDGLTVITGGEQPAYLAWLTPSTALISLAPDRAWVKARAARQGGLAGDSPLTALVSQVDRSAAVWFVGRVPAERAAELDGTLTGATGAFGAIHVGDGLTFDLAIRFDTAANAERARAAIAAIVEQVGSRMPPPIANAMKKTALSVAGADVRFELALGAAEVTALGDALAAFGD